MHELICYDYSMLPMNELMIRLTIALLVGALLGVERELVGKEAGVRTEMLVAGGAAIFAMIGLILPYITARGGIPDQTMVNSGLGIIANIVVGIGFLGAGVILKINNHPHGITTAALVWTTAGIGILIGIGLIEFGVIAGLVIAGLLFILRNVNLTNQADVETGQNH